MKVGIAGLGYWGPNLARNFDELGDLAWICEADGERLATYAIRYPDADHTSSYEEMLAADYSIDVAGRIVPAEASLSPLYDPGSARVRG